MSKDILVKLNEANAGNVGILLNLVEEAAREIERLRTTGEGKVNAIETALNTLETKLASASDRIEQLNAEFARRVAEYEARIEELNAEHERKVAQYEATIGRLTGERDRLIIKEERSNDDATA